MSATQRLIALAANDGWNIINYRAGLIRALQANDFKVAVLAPDGAQTSAIRDLGVEFRHIPLARRGTSPIEDFATLMAYVRQLRSLRPAAFLGFTVKPNIYGSIAAHRLGIPVINNVSGLGTVFAGRGALKWLVGSLYRRALKRSATIFFQNPDDRDLFVRQGIVPSARTGLLPGSGVDLDRFAPRPRPETGAFTFLLAARLLWDKGVAEFVEAARQLGGSRDDLEFQILGMIEPPSRAAVPEERLRDWHSEGAIAYLGAAADVRDVFARADTVVLPSYYPEGTPRVLLEASAMAIPVITTDTPGCREAVEDGVTGFLCSPRSVDSLIAAMERLLRMSAAERERMGAAGRARMARRFAEPLVHRAYLDALAECGVL